MFGFQGFVGSFGWESGGSAQLVETSHRCLSHWPQVEEVVLLFLVFFHFAIFYITVCSARWLFYLGFLLYLVFLSTFSTYIWMFYARYQIINIYQQSTIWFVNWFVKIMHIFSQTILCPWQSDNPSFLPQVVRSSCSSWQGQASSEHRHD